MYPQPSVTPPATDKKVVSHRAPLATFELMAGLTTAADVSGDIIDHFPLLPTFHLFPLSFRWSNLTDYPGNAINAMSPSPQTATVYCGCVMSSFI